MKFERFEDILAWQKSKELTKEIYLLFEHCKDYSFRDQIRGAAVSTMNNIAEGFGRQSNTEFRRFLFIAKGSSGEVRSMLILSKELGYLSVDQFESLYKNSVEISKILSGLIKKLN